MKLWIDDLRPPPVGWTWAKTSAGAIDVIEHVWQWEVGYPVPEDDFLEAVSFDHDLGGDDTTRPVMTWFCTYDQWPGAIYVHTSNTVGRQWLIGTADRYAPETTDIIEVWPGVDGSLPDM